MCAGDISLRISQGEKRDYSALEVQNHMRYSPRFSETEGAMK